MKWKSPRSRHFGAASRSPAFVRPRRGKPRSRGRKSECKLQAWRLVGLCKPEAYRYCELWEIKIRSKRKIKIKRRMDRRVEFGVRERGGSILLLGLRLRSGGCSGGRYRGSLPGNSLW